MAKRERKMVKSVDQIIGYLEGKLSAVKGFDPPKAEEYLIKEILNYIKEGKI